MLPGQSKVAQSFDSVDSGQGVPPLIGATMICRFLDFIPFPQLTLQGSHSFHDDILQFTRY